MGSSQITSSSSSASVASLLSTTDVADITSTEVSAYIKSIGEAYHEYARASSANGIDGLVLHDAAEDDIKDILKDLNVVNATHAKVLLAHFRKITLGLKLSSIIQQQPQPSSEAHVVSAAKSSTSSSGASSTLTMPPSLSAVSLAQPAAPVLESNIKETSNTSTESSPPISNFIQRPSPATSTSFSTTFSGSYSQGQSPSVFESSPAIAYDVSALHTTHDESVDNTNLQPSIVSSDRLLETNSIAAVAVVEAVAISGYLDRGDVVHSMVSLNIAEATVSNPSTNNNSSARGIQGNVFAPGNLLASSAAAAVQAMGDTDVFLTHEWGSGDHPNILFAKRMLMQANLKTWFHQERSLQENVRNAITDGIESTKCIVVFITKRYHDKVNSGDSRDFCNFEFEYAVRRLGSSQIIPVVIEKSMLIPRDWKGVLGAELGGRPFIDMTSSDPKVLSEKTSELCDRINESISQVTTIRYPDGSSYTGEIMFHKRNGAGVLRYPNGDEYQGNFVDDRMHGDDGKFVWANGNIYRGSYFEGLRHGRGCLFLANSGDKYEGDFKDDKRTGKGVLRFGNGDIYDGFFVNDRRHGRGMLKTAVSLYDGEFVDDRRHGKGKIVLANGDVFDGTWKADKKHKGVYRFNATLDVYSGYFKNDRFHGRGIYKWANGKRYDGMWENGQQVTDKRLCTMEI